jgi:hypothetical protein
MTRVRLLDLLLALTVAGVAMSFAGITEELDAVQLKDLNAGYRVSILKAIDGQPWPRVKIYARVAATSEEVAGVFFDYTTAKTYIPDVLDSRISKRVTARSQEVDYELNVPILPDEHYTALNELDNLEWGRYKISWRLLRARQTKSAEGNLRIEPSGDAASVICYTNLVTPGAAMAKLLRSIAINRMDKTVEALVKEVEEKKRSRPDDLSQQVQSLRAALAENP